MNEILYNTTYIQLKQTKAPDGHNWVYAHRPNAKDVVVILPILHEGNTKKLIFLETKRPPIYAENKAEFCIEFPAGLVGDENKSETIFDALKKELLEETGYEAQQIEVVAKNITSSSGLTSETLTYAIANITNLNLKQKPITDGGVITNIYKISLNNINNWLKEQQFSNKLISSQVFVALYFLDNFFKDGN